MRYSLLLVLFIFVQNVYGHGGVEHDHHHETESLILEDLDKLDKGISKVFIVYSNHFDMGYTQNVNGSCAGAVLNQYFHQHFPKAIKTAKIATEKGVFQYQWMTQSWIVDAFMNCEHTPIGDVSVNELRCPSDEQKQEFVDAVQQGWITWHALPFNAEPEMYTSPHMFEAALNLTFRLDDRFGLKRKRTMSQRDVPGLTRTVIPLLAKADVGAVSVGENMQCAPVNVPPVFIWKDLESKTQVLALFHASGYGRRRRLHSIGHELPHATCTDCDLSGPSIYVDEHGKIVASGDHCVKVHDVAICYAWKQDNMGPHSYFEARLIHDFVSLMFPHAKIEAVDSFDRFLDAVKPYMDDLPVVTQEIGDTWIYGATADPLKVALFRAASREHRNCLERGGVKACMGDDSVESKQSLLNFERLIMTVGEHTWGFDGAGIKYHAWSNDDLKRAIHRNPVWNTTVKTWVEQRSFLFNAVGALPANSPLAKAIKLEWEQVNGHKGSKFPESSNEFTEMNGERTIRCGRFSEMTIGNDGSIVSLVDAKKNMTWATMENPLFRLFYQNMDKKYFDDFADDYIAGISRIWIDATSVNLIKPFLNLKAINANVTLTNMRIKQNDHTEVILDMEIANMETHVERGAPMTFQAKIVCPNPYDDDNSFTYHLRWFNKTATHAPETMWILNYPALPASNIFVDKIGSPVNVQDADLGCDGHVVTCGVHLHGVGDEGVTYETASSSSMQIIPLDSPIVSIGSVDPVPTPLVKPEITRGVHIPLVGNIWNTNYPFWYPFEKDEDASSQFRFKVQFL